MLKFLADECCDLGLVTLLRAEGHDVRYQLEEKPSALDHDILEDAYKQERVLSTEDKDFGELVYRLRKPAKGIILIRFTHSLIYSFTNDLFFLHGSRVRVLSAHFLI